MNGQSVVGMVGQFAVQWDLATTSPGLYDQISLEGWRDKGVVQILNSKAD